MVHTVSFEEGEKILLCMQRKAGNTHTNTRQRSKQNTKKQIREQVHHLLRPFSCRSMSAKSDPSSPGHEGSRKKDDEREKKRKIDSHGAQTGHERTYTRT
jgi:hypothetical protein